MNIIYNKYTGTIEGGIQDDQNYKVYYSQFPQEFQDSIESIKIDNPPNDLKNYKVINRQIIRRSEEEIRELDTYGKILTEEERLNILLQPTGEEINKAENTLEILTTLEEVGLIWL